MLSTRCFLGAGLLHLAGCLDLQAAMTWKTVSRSDPNPYFSFHSVDFTGRDTGYAAGSGGTLYKTVDGGADWGPLSSGVTATLNGIRFPRHDVGLAVGEGGLILRTSDGGKSWIPRSSGTHQRLNAVYFPTPAIGYCVGDSGVVLKTEDAGISWRILSIDFVPPPRTVLFFDGLYFLNADTGWVTSSQHILRTADGGETWLGTQPPEANGIHSVWFLDPDTGFAVGGAGDIDGEMHKTVDGGRTWELASIPDANWHLVIRFLGKQGYLAGRPNGGSPPDMPILRTRDGGRSWTHSRLGTRGGIRDIRIVDTLVAFAVGDYGKIFRTLDGGITWTSRLGGPQYRLNGIAFADAKRGFAVGEAGTLLQTDDGGDRWEHRILPGSPYVRRIQFPTARRGYLVVIPHLLRTDDGGLTWDSLPLPRSSQTGPENVLNFLNQDTGFYLIDSLFRTADGGKTWTLIGAEGLDYPKHIGFADSERGFLSTDRFVFHTQDAGRTWTRFTKSPMLRGPFAFPSSRVGYAFLRDSLARTEDGGGDWRPISRSESNLLGFAFPTEQVGYMLDNPGSGKNRLRMTVDSGRTWTSDSLPGDWNWNTSLDVVGASAGFVAGEGSLILRFDAVVPVANPAPRPSPSGRRFRISGGVARIDLEADCDVTADLHDLQGRKVANLLGGRLSAGSHVLSAPAVPTPGIYLLRIQLGGDSQSSAWVLP